jgi:hypothetical protein
MVRAHPPPREAIMYKWSVGYSQPGYLPESEPALFDTRLEAVEYMIQEFERLASAEGAPDTDEIAEEYEAAATFLREHDADVDGDWSTTLSDGYAYWIESVDVPEGEEDF